MSVTSDEVNFLIYRYLQESGFSHSAFTFAYESLVTKSAVTAGDLPPGALISLLQKGLQYVEIEAHLNEDGSKRDCPDPFALLMPYAVRKRARIEREAPDADSAARSSSSSAGATATSSSSSGAAAAAASGRKASPAADLVRPDQVTNLRGHTNEVFVCRWNPKHELLASGSKDSTARIWSIPHGASGMAAGEAASLHPWVLDHAAGSGNGASVAAASAGGNGSSSASSDNGSASTADGASATGLRAGGAVVGKDVTTMDWDPLGELLATGTFDGTARIWDRHGSLKSTLHGHTGPIFSMQWNKSGTALLSGSMDKSAIVWDPSSGAAKQRFNFHTEPTLDVDWRDDSTFATCSSDKFIHVCEVGAQKPVKTFEGHLEEVNAIQWSPSGKLLASCSDDKTAKIWSVNQSSNEGQLVHDFTDHEREVCWMY
jgi:transducin (beta)-like 1